VDNFSGYLAGLLLTSKDETTNVLIDLLEKEKKQLGYLPDLICSDGGGEFTGTSLILGQKPHSKADFGTISSGTQQQSREGQ
jgi:hypothetical protein